MKPHRFPLFIMAGFSLSLAGYAVHAQADVTSQEVKQNAAETADSTATYAEQERDKYIRQAHKEIDELRTDIDRLAAQARTARAEAKVKLDKDIKILNEKRDAAAKKLSELQSANAGAWQQLKSGMDRTIEDLKQSFAKARKEFE